MKKLAKLLSLTLVFVTAVFMLTACVPSDVESAKEKMEEAGYFVSMPSITSSEVESGVVGKIKAQKLNAYSLPEDTIIALLFESSKQAKEYCESGGGWYDSLLTNTGHEGKWAYASHTEQAIKDFKA